MAKIVVLEFELFKEDALIKMFDCHLTIYLDCEMNESGWKQKSAVLFN